MGTARRRLSGAVALGLTATLTGAFAAPGFAAPQTPVPAPAVEEAAEPAGEAAGGKAFHRLATLPAYENTERGIETVAEISTVTADGNTVIHTDAAAGGIGFVDITDPESPQADGFVQTAGSPTSVFATEDYIIVVTDASDGDFAHPSGVVEFWDPETRERLHSLELDGQPDSIDVSPDGTTAFIALENQRDEDREDVDGGLPQLPAGQLAVIDLDVESVEDLAVTYTDLTGLEGLNTPEDPEPEYVKFSPDGTKAALTLQENNGVVILDAAGKVLSHFDAGAVALEGIDAAEDGNLSLDGALEESPREPDAIGWIDDEHVATANEGDWLGGTRGWTVFNADPESEEFGEVVWDAGTSFEDVAHRYGQYPEHRAENKGAEPEGLLVQEFDGVDYAFVGSERGNFVAVYNVEDPADPVFTQLLPSTNGPEGLLAVPERNLLIVSSETDDADNGVRATVQVFRLGEGPAASPTLKSADDPETQGQPITWSALGALSAVPGEDDKLYAAPDDVLSPSRIYTIDTTTADGGPATIESELVLEEGYDVEGLWADEDGTFWLAVEGTAGDSGAEGNRIVQVDADGQELDSYDLPAHVAAGLKGQGLEGVTGVGTGEDLVLYTVVQRAAAGEDFARIGKLTPSADDGAGAWEWFGYQLDTTETEGDWIGLSEVTAVDEDTLAVIERDKLNGPNAALKKVFTVDVPATGAADTADAEVEVLEKSEALDVLPQLQELNGWTQEKLEGLAIAGNGDVYAVTDNDGVEDATGETVFLNLGDADEVFGEAGADGTDEPTAGPVFSDNRPGSAFYAPVQWMAAEGIAVGQADGTFGKTRPVTRAETTAFLHRYADPDFTAPATSPFTDLHPGGAHFTPITWAATEQITAGYADGTFKPSTPVTRGQFAAFLYGLADPEHTAPATSPFDDLNVGGANYQAITWLAAEGVTVGDTRGRFNQSAPITRGQVSAFLQRYDRFVGSE
ncbi:MAG: esterase-like activity of phytase family protein [Micrococcus sp.]|nr:esterase-like activity of phytase family protein [Micrococcus sp.]